MKKLRMKLGCGLSLYLFGKDKFTPKTKARPASCCEVTDEQAERLLSKGYFEVVSDEQLAPAVIVVPVVEKPVSKPLPVVQPNASEAEFDDLTDEERQAIEEESGKPGQIEVQTMPAFLAKLMPLTKLKLMKLGKPDVEQAAQAYGIEFTDATTKKTLVDAILAKV